MILRPSLLLQQNSTKVHRSLISAYAKACSCLCRVSLCTDLVTSNTTETRIKLYVSVGTDMCFTGECGESEVTDIPLEPEKWAGAMLSVCLLHSGPMDSLFRGCWWLYVLTVKKQKHSLKCSWTLIRGGGCVDLESYYYQLISLNRHNVMWHMTQAELPQVAPLKTPFTFFFYFSLNSLSCFSFILYWTFDTFCFCFVYWEKEVDFHWFYPFWICSKSTCVK